jgi:hypothetical protein
LIQINQDDKEILYRYRGDGLRHSAQVRKLTESQGKTNLYVCSGNNQIMFVDPSGEIFMLVTGAAGAVVGGIGGVIYSGVKYGEVRWQNVAAGAVIGGAVGLTRGVAAAYITAGSDFASTGAVIVGTKVMVAGIGTVGYQTFQQFKDAYGRAGDGRAWHHIVEQSAANINNLVQR